MMDPNLLPLYILIGVISLVSFIAFSNQKLLESLLFNQGAIQLKKQFYRMLSSAFVHANFMHLFFNMWVLFIFGSALLTSPLGGTTFLLAIFFLAVLSGSLVSYWLHYNQFRYSALGASGGVTGVLLAYVVMAPDENLYIIFIPIGIPGYIFATLYLIYSIYAMQKNLDNIGHDAHLGGALVGILVPLIMHPDLLAQNGLKIALVCIPMVYFLYYVLKKRKEIQ